MNSSLLEKDSDRRLLEQIVQEEEAAFNLLYRRYGERIFHYVYGFFFNESVAEDIASDFWATVWTRAHTYRGDASVKNWLFRIARNKALDELRRTKKEHQHVESQDHTETFTDIPDNRDTLDDELERKQESEMIQSAIRQLSTEHREVLELFYYQGMKYQEIEKILQVPLGTVKTRLLSAKAKIKHALEDSGHLIGHNE